MGVLQVSSQASSVCSATWDWTKRTLRSGSMPQATSTPTSSRTLARSSAGSKGTVMACSSTMQKKLS